MRLHLPNGRYVSVEAHSGAIWLSSYNGCGTVNALTYDQAEEIGLALWRAGRKARRKENLDMPVSLPGAA